MRPTKTIRTVDLNDYTSDAASRKRLIDTLGQGLQETGFLNVEGHGIDSSLIDGTYDATASPCLSSSIPIRPAT
jgi:isopenicillin N synthase-like dioxygenase